MTSFAYGFFCGPRESAESSCARWHPEPRLSGSKFLLFANDDIDFGDGCRLVAMERGVAMLERTEGAKDESSTTCSLHQGIGRGSVYLDRFDQKLALRN